PHRRKPWAREEPRRKHRGHHRRGQQPSAGVARPVGLPAHHPQPARLRQAARQHDPAVGQPLHHSGGHAAGVGVRRGALRTGGRHLGAASEEERGGVCRDLPPWSQASNRHSVCLRVFLLIL
ncbi:unnamed protein product, partial [Prorocentrum cordatum]